MLEIFRFPYFRKFQFIIKIFSKVKNLWNLVAKIKNMVSFKQFLNEYFSSLK
jgi:hypothetical protein